MLSVIQKRTNHRRLEWLNLTERTVVIGNTGSGKSTLAKAVADLAHVPAIDFDVLHWEEGS